MKKWFLPLTLLSLGLMGLVTLSSVSPDLMRRQFVFLFLGFSLFWGVSQIPFWMWLKWSPWLWKGLVAVLIGLLVFGQATRGATAWFDVGWGLRFQPSQFAVLAVSLFVLARFVKTRIIRDVELIELLLITAVPALLIIVQPDFGTVFLYAVAISPLLIWQKIPKKYWQWFTAGSAALILVGWLFILEPYQKLRITSFMAGSQADQSDAGYNARQALIAVGAGQIFGRGLGHGTQSQLRFLPERQTDFIFASLAEEWGLIGSLTVILLYAGLIIFLLQQAAKTSQTQKSLFLIVTAVSILAQVFVNIGMNMGLVPITGITLPLVSYGGSSLLATMLLLGVAHQIITEMHEPSLRRIT